MTGRRVTLGDVARAAGVSSATVSRSLRDDAQISGATKTRVRQVADELGYVPNIAAQSLVLQQTKTFGLLIPDVTDPIHGQIVSAFHQTASGLGYSVILANGLRDPVLERSALRSFASHSVAGVATMGSILRQEEALDLLGPSKAVFLMAENLRLTDFELELPFGCLRCDDRDGMRQVAELIASHGFESTAFVGVTPSASLLIRREALVGELATFGLPPPVIHTVHPHERSAYAALARRLRDERPDAVVCYDDQTALALIDALRSVDLSVPDDVAVIGFDDTPFARLANPRLTTVAQPSAEMASRAAQMLADVLEHGDSAASQLLPVSLIERESTKRRSVRRRPRSAPTN